MQPMRTFDPDALECLASIVEEGGFERAATRLSITQSAVSQRLRALEVGVDFGFDFADDGQMAVDFCDDAGLLCPES